MLISKREARDVATALKTELRQEVLLLRTKGYSNYDISEKLGLPYPFVVEFVVRQALLHTNSDPRKEKRQLEEARLELLFLRAYQSFDATGAVDWYDRLLNTSARKSKLLGLDAPLEQIVTTQTGDEGVGAALRAVAERLPV